MKKRMVAKISLLLAILLVTCIVSPVALATDGADEAVSAVIEQLEAIQANPSLMNDPEFNAKYATRLTEAQWFFRSQNEGDV